MKLSSAFFKISYKRQSFPFLDSFFSWYRDKSMNTSQNQKINYHSQVNIRFIHISVALVVNISEQADGFSRHITSTFNTEFCFDGPRFATKTTDKLLIGTFSPCLKNNSLNLLKLKKKSYNLKPARQVLTYNPKINCL